MTRLTISILTTFLLFGLGSSGQTAQDTLDNKYKDAITKADTLFFQKHFRVAIQYYLTALTITNIPAKQSYCKSLLDAAHASLGCIKEIDEADSLFCAKNYSSAREHYYKGINYDQQYCKNQIDECNKLERDIDYQYRNTVKIADTFFIQQKYDKAKSAYNYALTLKSGDKYSSDQITICDKYIAKQKK